MVAKINSYKLFILSSLVFLTSSLMGGCSGCCSDISDILDKYLDQQKRNYIFCKEANTLHVTEKTISKYIVKIEDVESYEFDEEKKNLDITFKSSGEDCESGCGSLCGECCDDSEDDYIGCDGCGCSPCCVPCDDDSEDELIYLSQYMDNSIDTSYEIKANKSHLYITKIDIFKFSIDKVYNYILSLDGKYLTITFNSDGNFYSKVFGLENLIEVRPGSENNKEEIEHMNFVLDLNKNEFSDTKTIEVKLLPNNRILECPFFLFQ